MCLSVVCSSHIGCRFVWLKGTANGSGLPSPQPLYAIAKVLKWQSSHTDNLKLEKDLKPILELLFFVYIEHVKFQKASFNSN